MRILWSSNALWCNSGYGVQAKHVIPGFQSLGHKVAQHAWYGLQGGMLTLGEVPIYPMAFDLYGNDIVEAHAQHFKADIVVSLMDVWVLHEYGKKRMRWIPYMPIDSEPVPAAILNALQGAYRVLSYSKFGEKSLNACGVKNTMIPHGVDTKIFTPGDKLAAKKKLGFAEDDFVIGMVAANKGMPSRKAFPEDLTAVAAWKQRHPGVKVKLYLHTYEGQQTGGVDLSALLKDLGFKAGEVMFVNQYLYLLGLSEQYMATAYNAMDVLLAASMSEGFGIPLIEAQACGTPVIATNFSAMPELVFGGWLADISQRFWTGLNTWYSLPSIDAIVESLESAWRHRTDEGIRKQAREGALPFDWDTILQNHWKPFLDEIAAELPRPIAMPELAKAVA